MEHKIAETNARIDVADVLRGLAVMGIILLHSIEHFNFYSFPEEVPFEWMKFTDQAIWRGLFFTFSNKAYAVFALLFGFSFYIQDNNQQRRGKDFRLRFLWRLFILFIIGQFNAAFFTGEILTMYASFGVGLPLSCLVYVWPDCRRKIGKGICWGFVSWLLGIMKSCRWDIGDWWMVIWMGSEGRT